MAAPCCCEATSVSRLLSIGALVIVVTATATNIFDSKTLCKETEFVINKPQKTAGSLLTEALMSHCSEAVAHL